MKTLALILLTLALTLSSGAALAGEDSLLARLDRECRALAGAADAATVEIRAVGTTVWISFAEIPSGTANPARGRVLDARGWSYTLAGRRATGGVGVLVGTPPVLVTAADALGSRKEVEFRLADGTTGRAKLRGRDVELGVSVFVLPDAIAAVRKGLELDGSDRVARGRLVLVTGPGRETALRPLDLAMARGASPLDGWFALDGLAADPHPGQPAVGVDGRLVGIAAPSAGHIVGRSGINHLPPGTWETSYLNAREWLEYGPRQKQGKAKEPAAPKKAEDAWSIPYVYVYGDLYATTARSRPAGSFIPGAVIGRVVDDLAKHGRVRHSYLGVVLGAVRGKGESRGVEVRSVLEDSPAAKAGIRPGARVATVDGVSAIEPGLLNRALVQKRPGETIRLGMVGDAGDVRIVLGDRAEAVSRLVRPADLGLFCVEIDVGLRSFLGLPAETRGVVIRLVRADSPAVAAGLARGQVIVGGGGEPIADLEEFRAVVAGAKGTLELEILEGQGKRVRTIRIPALKVGSRTR